MKYICISYIYSIICLSLSVRPRYLPCSRCGCSEDCRGCGLADCSAAVGVVTLSTPWAILLSMDNTNRERRNFLQKAFCLIVRSNIWGRELQSEDVLLVSHSVPQCPLPGNEVGGRGWRVLSLLHHLSCDQDSHTLTLTPGTLQGDWSKIIWASQNTGQVSIYTR